MDCFKQGESLAVEFPKLSVTPGLSKVKILIENSLFTF